MSFVHYTHIEIDVLAPNPQEKLCRFTNDCGLKWKVQFGISNHPSENRVQIVLEKLNNYEALDFKIEAYVENIHGMKEYYFRMLSPLDGSTKFCIFNISAQEFSERRNDLYPDDILHLHVIIAHEHDNTGIHRVTEIAEEYSKELSEHSLIDCPGYNLLNLLLSGEMADVFIKCGDRIFSAHMAILSARLPMMAARFLNDNNNNNDVNIFPGGFNPIIHITDIEPSVMVKLLLYTYTGALLDVTMDMAMKLFLVSVRYEVHKLTEACSKRIIMQLNDRNICDVLLMAHACKNDYLMKVGIEYLRNRKYFLNSRQWLLFVDKDSTLANWVIREINKPSKL